MAHKNVQNLLTKRHCRTFTADSSHSILLQKLNTFNTFATLKNRLPIDIKFASKILLKGSENDWSDDICPNYTTPIYHY